ncbi:MAG: putative endonuclease [Acidimicrobiia bacterium]|jgi:putative endonuclease|nr:putative endonuclease [Acidimicrobiia bacterium]
MGRERQALGAFGEELVARWYDRAGYDVVGRNWRCQHGEIDLIVVREDLVAFCEVKTRTSQRYGAPVEAVTRAKQLRLRRLAGQWLTTSPWRPRRVRFDVASVTRGEVTVVEDAF